MEKKKISTSPLRPPIVAVLGHVDHGKTTLLDTIRHTSVAAKEFGGITQHIGAYQVEVESLKSKDGRKKSDTGSKKITFIDTPGHEAFAKMRSRGASAADIVILVVAADDSVKPQTIESIEQIKKAQVPLIVAINKMDVPGANPGKVKQDLAKYGVQVEGFGGDVPFVLVSAKTGDGVPALLDTISLMWDMQNDGKAPETGTSFKGTVIETNIDKGRGLVASIIVKEGTLKYASKLYVDEKFVGKVRAMVDEFGAQVKEATPGKPVQIMGFETLPEIGSVLTEEQLLPKEIVTPVQKGPMQPYIPDFLKPLNEIEQKLTILLKADTMGSLEAILASLPSKIDIASQGLGDIGEADIMDAKASGAFVVGFNVSCKGSAAKLAETEKVVFRTYTIIYELIEELTEVVNGMKEVVTGEREVGKGTVIASFPFDKVMIAGTKVTSGRIARGDQVKIMRGEAEIGRARVKSLRQGKLEVTKVEVGQECGVLFDKNVAFSLQDDIIAFIR
jgi:translation initiation factor IF-2